jgi:poly(3-hydroxybutyrate) depolymerase
MSAPDRVLARWFLALTLGVLVCATPAMGTPPPAMCNPFGNPRAIFTGVVKPDCLHGKLLGPWKDPGGAERYACLWEPYRAPSKGRLPMVVYLHPSLFGPKTVEQTGLLLYQDSVSLSADGTTGYIVLAPIGRKTLHHYPRPDEKGLGWDNWYRQLSPGGAVTVGKARYLPNADAVTLDHFIAEQVAGGRVDPARIYLTGWSNGAAMALLYGLNRRNIAAAAVYSAPDPFGALSDPCPQTPVAGPPENNSQVEVFNPGLPTMHVHNSCDIAGLCPNAERMARQIKAAGVAVRDTIIDYTQAQVTQCTLACGGAEAGALTPGGDLLGYSLGFVEHSRWPQRWTPVMLDFLRAHSLEPGTQVSDGGTQYESNLAH